MNINEARQIGESKMRIRPEVFSKAMEVAKEMGVVPQHMGPMALALAFMGVSKAHKSEDMTAELTDALALVSKAENEWRMERAMMGVRS